MHSVWWFQFHNGSIKTLNIQYALEHLTKFQFHNGSIKTQYRRFVVAYKALFQFHNGSIKTKSKMPCENLSLMVSIPQWFD